MPTAPRFDSEIRVYNDRLSGVPVRQLTEHFAHSYHLYFTNSGWFDDGRKLLIGSDRGNASNFYAIDLDAGSLRRLTDFAHADPPKLTTACINPHKPEAYLWHNRELKALDLEDGRLRTLCRIPDGFKGNILSCSADGEAVCTALNEDLSGRLDIALDTGYIGMDDYYEARPRCAILRIPTGGGEAQTLHEDDTWIGHVNTSPTRANLLSFCHEGPWRKVEQRIWMLDADTRRHWPLRRQTPEEAIGHEYWHADGVTVGYHGRHPDGRDPFFGYVRYDDSEKVEVAFPWGNGHIHSNDRNLVVGDDYTCVVLYRWNGQGYDPPRVLCEHRCSMHVQKLHVHPRLSPDGKQVLYTSDHTGYGQVYLVDIPPLDELPWYDDVKER